MAPPRSLKALATLLLCVGTFGAEWDNKGILSNDELQKLQSGALKLPTPGQLLNGAICWIAHHQPIVNSTTNAICGTLFHGKLATLQPECEAVFMKSWEASTSWCSNLQEKETLRAAFKFPGPGQIIDASICFIAKQKPIEISSANAICSALFHGKLADLQPQCEAGFRAAWEASTSWCPKLEETELMNAAFKFPTPGQIMDDAICFIADHQPIINSTANAICGTVFRGKLADVEPECEAAFEAVAKASTSFCHKLEEKKLLSAAFKFPTPGQILDKAMCWLAKQKPIESSLSNAICETLFRGKWASIQPQCEAAFDAAWELPMHWCSESQLIVV